MRFSTISLFPEIIQASTEQSIGQKALEKGLFELVHINIRNHAVNDYGKVDDALYGGGTGMLLMPEPVFLAVSDARRQYAESHPSGSSLAKEKVIYMSPRGKLLTQNRAKEFLSFEHIILLSGHYEGIDQRVLNELEVEEISIGDYVLTGGELATAVFIDVLMRMIPGVLPNEDAWIKESHSSGLLEEDQYTRPAEWRERQVPDVLLSGHAAKIETFRQASALKNTLMSRPEFLKQHPITLEEWAQLLKILDDQAE